MTVLAGFFALALIATLAHKTRLRPHFLVTNGLLLLTLCAVLGMANCGRDSVKPKLGTPPGTYSLTVSGAFASAASATSPAVVRNTQLTLVVQ